MSKRKPTGDSSKLEGDLDLQVHATVSGSGPQPVSRTLFVGKDNYDVLRGINSNTVDLVAMDPPFNKDAPFIGLVKDKELLKLLKERRKRKKVKVVEDDKAIKFNDIWSWNLDWHEDWLVRLGYDPKFRALRDLIRTAQRAHSPAMSSYICFMAARCLELNRILKDDGSIVLHCDHSACHYLRAMMDVIFGAHKFQSQIIWKRTSAHSSSHTFGNIYDVLLLYGTKKINVDAIRDKLDPGYVKKFYRHDDKDGRGKFRLDNITGTGRRKGESGEVWQGYDVSSRNIHWTIPTNLPDFFEEPENWDSMGTLDRLDELQRQDIIHWPGKKGMPAFKRYYSTNKGQARGNIWLNPPPLSKLHKEKTGWPTQKPLELYERIILACSQPGDLVLDPFCGCATTCVAAERITQSNLGERRWIGIDIAEDADIILDHRLSHDVKVSTDARANGVLADPKTGKHVAGLQDVLVIRDFAIDKEKAIPKRTDDMTESEPYLPPQELSKLARMDLALPYGRDFFLSKFRDKMRKKLADKQWYHDYTELQESGSVKCESCGVVLPRPNLMQIDHIIPLNFFREHMPDALPDFVHHISNLQFLCSTCNSKKGAKTVLEGAG